MSLRPTKLELEGFGSFRAPTTINFDDADLFVLSGPTGAGKSTVIDAITFALYGIVPRYDDRRLVEPIISKGLNEARVRLDFRVGDHTYSAVRVVRRTSDGRATTKESRLERWRGATNEDTVTLADQAGELGHQVERLLGLTYDHFTTCVVLPQGAFQEFLHAKPKARRDLLVDLLDLGVYAKVGAAARTAAAAAKAQLELHEATLDGQLRDATPEHLAAAQARVAQLGELQQLVDERQPALDELLAEGSRQAALAKDLAATSQLLVGLAMPDDVQGLTMARSAAEEQVRAAEAAVTAADAAHGAARTALANAGSPAPLRELRDVLSRIEQTQTALAAAVAAHEGAVTQRADLATSLDASGTDLRAADDQLEHARQQDLVAAVTEGCKVGDDCPVCGTALTDLPARDVDSAVATAQRVVAAATAARDAAQRSLHEADGQLSRAAATLATHTEQLATLTTRRDQLVGDGLPADVDEIDLALTALSTLEGVVAEQRQVEEAARNARRQAESAEAATVTRLKDGWQAFDQTRDRLAGLAPPPRVDDDLAASWTAVLDWRDTRLPTVREQTTAAASALDTSRAAYREANTAIQQSCLEAGVEPTPGQSPRDAVVTAAARASADAERLASDIERAAELRTQVATARQRTQVATALGTHLKSDRFQEWLVRRALAHLVTAASQDLRAMSDDAYSLVLDDGGDFAVVDHRNGDEVRPARTLSGGETFLASLALALSLSQRVADLAADGAARLDALFLDEGFGTLDADTLATVADALEELGSRGRMVGVITHVPELAARLPVRFDVRKVGGSSTITRVDDNAAAMS